MLGHARLLKKPAGQNLFMANRMEQIVKKINFRQNEMIKAYDLAFLNKDEVAKK